MQVQGVLCALVKSLAMQKFSSKRTPGDRVSKISDSDGITTFYSDTVKLSCLWWNNSAEHKL